MRVVRRVVMAAVGVAVLAGSVGFAALFAYALWVLRPAPGDWLPTLALVLLVTLVLGYVSHALGTSRIVDTLDAVELTAERAPELHRRVDALCDQMDVDRPRLLVARLAAPNALAVGGRDDGVLVLDRSLFRLLTARELEGIVAHELAHIERRDSLLQSLAYSVAHTFAGLLALVLFPASLAVSGLARATAWFEGRPGAWRRTVFGRVHVLLTGLVSAVLLLSLVVLRAQSRRREYAADDRAADVTGDPVALARALQKIERATTPNRGLLSLLFQPERQENPLLELLSTHPATEDRVERLLDRAA